MPGLGRWLPLVCSACLSSRRDRLPNNRFEFAGRMLRLPMIAARLNVELHCLFVIYTRVREWREDSFLYSVHCDLRCEKSRAQDDERRSEMPVVG